MDKEDVEEMLDIAMKSKRNAYAVGIGMLIIGSVYILLGDHAVQVEIIVSGIVMFFVGLYFIINGSWKFGIVLVVLGILFEILTELFEAFHALEMFLEFGSICVASLIAAYKANDNPQKCFTSVIVAIAAGITAVMIIVEHKTTMDFLMTVIGIVLVAISIYLLWATKNSKEFALYKKIKAEH